MLILSLSIYVRCMLYMTFETARHSSRTFQTHFDELATTDKCIDSI